MQTLHRSILVQVSLIELKRAVQLCPCIISSDFLWQKEAVCMCECVQVVAVYEKCDDSMC